MKFVRVRKTQTGTVKGRRAMQAGRSTATTRRIDRRDGVPSMCYPLPCIATATNYKFVTPFVCPSPARGFLRFYLPARCRHGLTIVTIMWNPLIDRSPPPPAPRFFSCRQPGKHYPIALWGPILLGTVGGCGGLFLPLDKGLKVTGKYYIVE